MIPHRLPLLTFLLLSLATTVAECAPPGQKPDDHKEFVPHAGYSRTLKQMRARRLIGMPLAPGETRSLKGTRSIPVVCVAFDNVAAPFTAAEYETLLFSNGPGVWSMSTYYRDISHGVFQVAGKALGPYKLPDKDTVYEGSNNGLGGAHFGLMLKHAFTKADADTDFGQFDNDGPDGLPNSGDDDGKVDTIFIIHPEIGGECKRAGQDQNIWSHSWHYSEGLGHTESFTTGDVSQRKDPDTGSPIPGAKILIEDYTVQPGLSCTSTSQTKRIIEIGVYCHEYGHALGLPDLYDRTAPQAECVGNWCLMAAGSYGGNNSRADRPSHMSAWCKTYLGWTDVKPLTNALTHTFEPVDTRNRVYRFTVPGTSNLEYFLIEYRRKSGWDEFLHADGLAIWHVDERVGGDSDNWPFAPEDQGQNDSPNTLAGGTPPPLWESDHQLVALIQSDGLMNLENTAAGNRGDSGDLFRNGDFPDDPAGKKGSRAYDGTATGLEIFGIQLAANEVKARVKTGAGPMAAPPVVGPTPKPNFSADHIGKLDFLKGIQPTVKDLGFGGLDDAAKDKLKKTPEFLLHHVDQGDFALFQAAAKSRTKTINKATVGTMPMSNVLKNIVNASESDQIQVRFDAGGDDIEQILHLSADLNGRNFREDALHRTQEWKDLAGQNVTLKAVATPAGAKVQKFTQNLNVKGKSLPVFGKQQAFYYSPDKLIGVTCSPLARELEIVGESGDLKEQDARELVAKTLGIPESKANSLKSSEGLYVSEEWPLKAQVAIKVSVPAGDQQQNLEFYVDSTTGKIVAVK